MTLLSKSSKGSSSPPTYSKLSSNEFQSGIYSAMNVSSIGLTDCAQHNTNNSSNRFVINTSTSKNHSSCKSKKYHLIKPNDLHDNSSMDDKNKQQDITSRLVSEVYLTRLLATKVGLCIASMTATWFTRGNQTAYRFVSGRT
jgi:hypothetical protein